MTVIGGKKLYWGQRTYLMGIINLSTDSFSGDGNACAEVALNQAQNFVKHGATIIDVGGESTKPDATPIAMEREISLLAPAIRLLCQQVDAPICIDSYKYEVVKTCLDAGANMINDIWGLQYDIRLALLAAEYGVPIILTSNQRRNKAPENILTAIITDLQRAIETCQKAKVPDENIIIDPGIGFGKTIEQNLEILGNLKIFRTLGYPIMIGTSRKSMIGAILEQPENERLAGTAATCAIGIANGADIIRVHDVQFMSQLAKMSDAIVRRNQQ